MLVDYDPTFLMINSLKGGAEDPEGVRDLTRGHFDSNLVGCVRNVVVMEQSVDPTAAAKGDHAVSGMNVYDCSQGPEEEEADVR